MKNITTLDVSENKLESLDNFQHMKRIKRLLARQNFVRTLKPIQDCRGIYELDLESNAIDSHKDFLMFIKDKPDLIIVNLNLNPLMVDVPSIDALDAKLVKNAPELITKKSAEEINEIKQLLGIRIQTEEEPNPEAGQENNSDNLLGRFMQGS
jgi:Leucine-rich repeat (LRR) protein